MSSLRRWLLRVFALVYRVDAWVNRRFTVVGLLALAALVGGAVFGIDFRQTQTFRLASLGGAVLAIAMGSAAFFRGRFDIERDLPRYATLGEELRYSVRVWNRSGKPVSAIELRERVKETPPSVREFLLTTEEPGRRRRNLFDRYIGYPRWAWLMRRSAGATTVAARAPLLPPGEPVDLDMRLRPLRRGYVRLLPCDVSRTDPFGVFRAIVKAGGEQSVLVLPRRYPVDLEAAFGATARRAGGESPGTSIGASEEFAGVREYRPGDSRKHIHWRTWARLGEPIVKDYQDQVRVRMALVLDTFVAFAGDRFEAAITVAASIACRPGGRTGSLDLMFIGLTPHRISMGHGQATLGTLLEALAVAEACPDQRFAALTDLVIRHAGDMSSCVCVLLGWDAERQALVAALRALGVPVLVLVVGDPVHGETGAGPLSDQPDRLRFLAPQRIREGLAALSAPGRPARDGG
jgi:uncharacterized protein (DUF58 family)